VSTGQDQNEVNLIEQARRQINRLAEEIAHLSEMDLQPQQYYGEFLQRVLTAIAAPAGAVWLRTPQGNLQLQYHINMQHVGLNRDETSRETHNKLLEEAFKKAQPGLIPPRSGLGPGEGGAASAGNPTDFVILLAPILVDKHLEGIVEIWQDPNRGPDAQRGFLQFLIRMAGLASAYTRNFQLRQMVGQQAVWTQLEAFARQVHGSLNPTEVAYLVANEGRRLVECDRVSVACRFGKRVKIEAISGADIVEKRSNLVQLMRALIDAVLEWDEKLVYTGTKDDTLPPKVIKALDAYLAESNSKLLVCLPLRDEREEENKKPARSAVLMEAFEPQTAPEQMVARLEVVGRHSTAALYNSAEHKRIPMRFLWAPIARLQEGLGGKARAIWTLVLVLLLALIGTMVFVPYPLRMEANGQLLPRERNYLYSPVEAKLVDYKEGLKPGSIVFKDQELILLYSDKLASDVTEHMKEVTSADAKVKLYTKAYQEAKDKGEKASFEAQLRDAEATRSREYTLLEELRKLYNADVQHPGYFWLKSPLSGRLLTGDFKDLKGSFVKPSQQLLRVGRVDTRARKANIAEWEIELKIPQKNIGQILRAFEKLEPGKELDVDLLLSTSPTRTFKGKLRRDKISPEAMPNRSENNESEPVVLAWVRIYPVKKNDKGEDDPSGKYDIPEAYRLPPELLLTGTEVRSRVRCGNRAMGYSLFYGVWEFIYENIVFFF
jgi:hypothetical protein